MSRVKGNYLSEKKIILLFKEIFTALSHFCEGTPSQLYDTFRSPMQLSRTSLVEQTLLHRSKELKELMFDL